MNWQSEIARRICNGCLTIAKIYRRFFSNNWKSLDYFLTQNRLIFVNFSKIPEEFAIQRFAKNGTSKQIWKCQGFFVDFFGNCSIILGKKREKLVLFPDYQKKPREHELLIVIFPTYFLTLWWCTDLLSTLFFILLLCVFFPSLTIVFDIFVPNWILWWNPQTTWFFK